jgi:K+-transporting ATPase ATPase C chain
VLLTLVFAVLLCGAYPLAVWAAGQALFATKANGSLVTDGSGVVRGSALIGQSFASEKYFQSRPSAAGAGYDASNSSGTNLGSTSRKLNDSIKSAVDAYRAANGLKESDPVPADAVTSSGSGLDPHISVANAEIQARRVARVRQIPLEQVLSLVAHHVEGRDWDVLGEPGVNVLKLNLALDQHAGR